MPSNITLASSELAEINAGNLQLLGFQDTLQAATHYINAKYDSMGGAGGVLGVADGNFTVCPDGVGYFRHFWNNGSIYWTPSTGAIAVLGSIREKWASLQWERGFLGYPVHDEVTGASPHTAGSTQVFQGGQLFTHSDLRLILDSATAGATVASGLSASATEHPATVHSAAGTAALRSLTVRSAAAVSTTLASSHLAANRLATTGAARETAAASDALRVIAAVRPPTPSITNTHEVHGAILAKYRELGAEASLLGYPTTDETTTPDTIGRYNHFQAGSIYWTPSTGAHEVHGLIRDYWAAHGWERNAGLGYPISDELIPDRRIGHVKPETTRKPIAHLPADVVKLPVEAAAAGAIARSGVNVMTEAKKFPGSEVAVDSGLLAGLLLTQPASTPAPQGSVNRFADFENGVLFWQRGSQAAQELSPWLKAADGTVIQKTPADILSATLSHLGGALQMAGGNTVPVSAGTTATYAWDGAGTQNRRHQIQVSVTVIENSGGLFNVPIPRIISVVLYVLVNFEPERRKITAFLADYATGEAAFAAKLDTLLWSPYDILTFPDTNGGEPYSILSVKTMPNGVVNTYIEPASLSQLVLKTVATSPLTAERIH